MVGEGTVVYWTVTVGDSGDGERPDLMSHLVELDLEAGTTTELAPLVDLFPEGVIPDLGTATGITSDLRYAVLWAQTKANATGQGPTAYVYELETQTLTPHTPPGSSPQTLVFQPLLVNDEWIAYTPSSREIPAVYLAPLAEPGAAIEVFRGGTLVAVRDNRLFIVGENLVILDLDL